MLFDDFGWHPLDHEHQQNFVSIESELAARHWPADAKQFHRDFETNQDWHRLHSEDWNGREKPFDEPGWPLFQFRELTDKEATLIATEPPPIVVTGYRVTQVSSDLNTAQWVADTYDQGGSSSQPEPPDCTCYISDEQLLDSFVDEEVADALREILAQADQRMEYGSVIYVDAFGQIVHSPLRTSPDFTTQLDFSGVPLGPDGTTDFSRVLAVVHSHPEWLPNEDGSAGYTRYYDPNDPDYLLTPSVRDDRPDDWDFYSDISSRIAADGGDPSQFSMYIAGFNGSTLVLNQYHSNDDQTTTSQDGDDVAQDYVSPASDCALHGGG